MFTATFVLSTGRCGTQWLAETIKAHYREILWVEHEPLHNGYEPRLMLGGCAPSPALVAHVESIESRLKTQSYLECGHPCWSSLPFLRERLGERVRIVHLTRHPVPTSLSWLTHRAYAPPLLPHLKEKTLLSPFDPGVSFPSYQQAWPSLSPFEKCLYYWAEVNAFGLRLAKEREASFLRLSFESLFAGPGISALLTFLNLVERQAVHEARAVVVDRQRAITETALPDILLLQNHAEFTKVARWLGYELSALDPNSLKERYAPVAT